MPEFNRGGDVLRGTVPIRVHAGEYVVTPAQVRELRPLEAPQDEDGDE